MPLDGAPGKSGAEMERLMIDGQPYVLKRLDLARDWTLRASGCLPGPPLVLWQRGILDRLPGCINQPIVAVAGYAPASTRPSGGCLLLMRDVSPWLVPATDGPSREGQHARFLRHMAALHAAFWGCGRECDVVPAMHRYLELSPWLAKAELAIGSDHLVPQLVGQGLAAAGRGGAGRGRGSHPAGLRPGPAGGRRWPRRRRRSCTATGSWTTSAPTTGAGRCCSTGSSRAAARALSATWPGTWRSTAAACRSPRRRRSRPTGTRWRRPGVDTGPWWDRQLALCLLGALVQFGWEKALGGYDEELAWWEDRAIQAAPLLVS